MKKMTRTMLAGMVFVVLALAVQGLAKPLLTYDFETPDQVDALVAVAKTGSEIKAEEKFVHSGNRALRIMPNIQGSQNAPIPFPKGLTQGVISFWFYDSIFEYAPNGSFSRAGWDLGGNWKQADGKNKWGSICCDNGRGATNWIYDMGDGSLMDSGFRRHEGWTKFDIVIESAGANRLVIIYIDGRENRRIRAEAFTPTMFQFRTFWGASDIIIDDLIVDDDPASFRPGVVQTLGVGDGGSDVKLLAGKPLKLDFTLDPKGAAAKSGQLQIELFDLQQQLVSKIQKPITWEQIEDTKFTIQLPSPPASKHYWVVASYRDEGAVMDACRTFDKIDVQYLSDAKVLNFRDKITFQTPWNWLAADRAAMDTLPAKWDGATKIANYWNNKLKDVTAGWYHREIEIPSNWSGRRILLSIEQPANLAKAFINGVSVGEVVWPGGELDITDKIKPGSKAQLVILVDWKAFGELTKAAELALSKGSKFPEWYFSESSRGLGGEVQLLAVPMGAKIDFVTITPHVPAMILNLDIQTLNLTQGENYSVEGTLSKAGKVLKTFKSESFKASDASHAVSVSIPWPDAELWDIGKPNLYDLDARLVSGSKTLDALLPQRFGFREVVFDGRLVKINGNPVNFVTPMPTSLQGNFGFAQCMTRNNMNYMCVSHYYYYAREGGEKVPNAHNNYDTCDEAGIGSDMGVSDITLRKLLVNYHVANNGSFLDDPIYWPAFEKSVKRAIARWGNRPSIFFFLGGGNGGQLEMGNMLNPTKQDGIWLKTFDDKAVMRQLLAVEIKARELLHRIDPRKPVIGQDAGNFNDAIHITHYAGFMPIQEFIESNSYWVKNGIKPYMITEQTAPWTTDWTSGARKGHNSPDRFSQVAQRAAMTKGDAAFYRTEVDQEDLTQFEKRVEQNQARDHKNHSGMQPPLGPLYAYQRRSEMSSQYKTINYERTREEWLNWRAEGLGLLCDWDNGMAGKEQAKQEAWAPVTGFIAGTTASRTDKTHILRPGEVWDRQFLVMSNRRDSARVLCKWIVVLNGKEIHTGSAKAQLTPGGQASIPITYTMPVVEADAAGTLTVALFEDDKQLIIDKMDFQILVPKKALVIASRIALIDPEGASAEALDKSGIKYQRLQFNADLSKYQFVIFGRKAFSYEMPILSRQLDLASLLAAGKKILILEQEEEILRNRFGFRTEYVSPRSVFGRIADHPVTKGLPDCVLGFWRGSATLTDGYETARKQPAEPEANGARNFVVWNDGKEHPRQMKWGNMHNVATVIIEKPGRGNFRTIVDCEFNLDYAAVLEFEQDSGRMVFCQADVSGRSAAEPAAERLLSNIVGYLDGAKPAAASAGIAYLGGEKGVDILDRLQARYRKVESPNAIKPGEIMMLGDDLDAAKLASWKEPIASFVQSGGVCFSLPRARDQFNWLPFEVTVKDSVIDATIIDKPSQPLFAGLSNGELYYSGRVPVVALDKVPSGALKVDTGILAEISSGKGRYIFCQVSPDSFDCFNHYYLEDSRKNSYRVFQTLLNNLGVPMLSPVALRNTAAQSIASSDARPAIDLTTAAAWMGLKIPASETTTPAASDSRWKPVKVPGYVGTQRKEWEDNKSFLFWYRSIFTVDKLPASPATATLFIGAIDDEDDVYLNGTKIGHTGRDTNVNDWLQAPRYYKIPANLLKEGENELIVRVFNYQDNCGINVGPVRINWTANSSIKPESGNATSLATMPPMDLSGHWWKILQLESGEQVEKIPADSDPRWSKQKVYLPSTVVETENRSVWCRRDINIKEIPAGARPMLIVGAVDDEDDTYLNGTKLGHIGKDTNPKNYWEAPRVYPIPEGVLKPGQNRLSIRVNNLPPGPGSVAGPLQIVWMPPDEAAKIRLSVLPYLFEVGRLEDPYWWCGGW